MGRVRALCRSEQKGTGKTPVEVAVFEKDHGMVGDAHAGKWHRQVSLLSIEKIDDFRARGGQVDDGDFGENIIVEGFDLSSLPVGSIIEIGESRMRLTQIGKACHDRCAIYHKVGDCIMPREGIFAEVLETGEVKVGDEVRILPPEANRLFTAAIITLSDKGAQGEREDKSGPLIQERLEATENYEIVETLILSDEPSPLKRALMELADQRQVDLILTTGGTGFSMRDHTPEATEAVCDRMTPGIAEAIRAYSMNITKRAMLSRATAGIRKSTLIVNMPGSPKACDEALDCILDTLGHGIEILRGSAHDCARED